MVKITTKNWKEVKKLEDLPLTEKGTKFSLTSYLDGCGFCDKIVKESVNKVCDVMEKHNNQCFGINGGTAEGQKLMQQLGIEPAFPQNYMCETLESKDGKPQMRCAVGRGWVPENAYVDAAKKIGLIDNKDL